MNTVRATSAASLPLLALLCLAATPALAEARSHATELVPIRVETVATGLNHPWGMAFLPDGSILLSEREGAMRLLSPEGQLSPPLAGLPKLWTAGQGGLLDVAVADDFATSSTVYFTFSEPGGGGAGTALARARLVRVGDGGRLADFRILFSMPKKSKRGQHFGSRIVVHPDGTVLFSTGDRGQAPRAQDMTDAAGAILRVNADGSVPKDNPYASASDGTLPQIWSKGHRNPQGFAIDSAGTLWTAEHGARGGDEINQPLAGHNYGWPVVTYGVNYNGDPIGLGTEAPGFEAPLHHWDPSIAPSGLAVYEGAMFPEWKGDLLVGALKFQLLSRLDRDASGRIVGEERMLEGEYGRIRDVAVAEDGAVWLLTDDSDGKVLRISRD